MFAALKNSKMTVNPGCSCKLLLFVYSCEMTTSLFSSSRGKDFPSAILIYFLLLAHTTCFWEDDALPRRDNARAGEAAASAMWLKEKVWKREDLKTEIIQEDVVELSGMQEALVNADGLEEGFSKLPVFLQQRVLLRRRAAADEKKILQTCFFGGVFCKLLCTFCTKQQNLSKADIQWCSSRSHLNQ